MLYGDRGHGAGAKRGCFIREYYVNLVDGKTTDIISARICYPVKHKEISEIWYSNILILDEPKQQNLANDSLVDCITVIENISFSDNQIILQPLAICRVAEKCFVSI